MWDASKHPCPHSKKTPYKKRDGSAGLHYTPGCCKAYCSMCGDEVKPGEPWKSIPALGIMHARDCIPYRTDENGKHPWSILNSAPWREWSKITWRTHG